MRKFKWFAHGEEGIVEAETRSKARYQIYKRILEAFGRAKFGDIRVIARWS